MQLAIHDIRPLHQESMHEFTLKPGWPVVYAPVIATNL